MWVHISHMYRQNLSASCLFFLNVHLSWFLAHVFFLIITGSTTHSSTAHAARARPHWPRRTRNSRPAGLAPLGAAIASPHREKPPWQDHRCCSWTPPIGKHDLSRREGRGWGPDMCKMQSGCFEEWVNGVHYSEKAILVLYIEARKQRR